MEHGMSTISQHLRISLSESDDLEVGDVWERRPGYSPLEEYGPEWDKVIISEVVGRSLFRYDRPGDPTRMAITFCSMNGVKDYTNANWFRLYYRKIDK